VNIKIDEIIKQMTVEEKAALCTGADWWTTTPIPRLGVPKLTVSDGPHGVRRAPGGSSQENKTLPATCFPTASCMASTWDVDLIHKVGEALADECIEYQVDLLLGPGANMKRTPLCGRNFEYYSEDPFLAGQMAASYIMGVQSKGVGTSLKHFATNNQETRRLTISAVMDERTLREIYLPAFEMAVKTAHPWTVMCAYNRLNGTYGAENHKLLAEILKDEWSFEGFVVSDWVAVHDRVASLKGGLDLEMPGPRDMRVKAVIEAVRDGLLDESILDESVRRILGIVFKAAETPKGKPYDKAAHHELARQVAAEGMVLLKNNGILPLKLPKHIAVIGRAAQNPYYQGGGSSHINPTRLDIPLDELKKLAGNATISYCEGYPFKDHFDQTLINEAVNNARQAEVALLYLALPEEKESEGYDRPDLDLTVQQVALIKAVTAAQPNSVVILNNGAPVVMSEWMDGPAAILEAWMMGQAGGGAMAEVLFGKVNPSGRLAETFPTRLQDTPAYINFPGENDVVRYGEGIFIGYRYYDARDLPVQFPFGHGLSYTTFEYQNPKVSASIFKDVDGVTVSVDVTNSGNLAGKEVVQVYVHDCKSQLARPPKELKGFAKVELKAGETKTVAIKLDFRAFAYFHPAYQRWITEDGEFDLLVGSSSADIRCRQSVTLQSTMNLPSILGRISTVRDWLADPKGYQILASYLKKLPLHVQEDFGGVKNGVIGIDVDHFKLDTPLANRLHSYESDLPVSPEQLVDEMLAQIYNSGGKSGQGVQALEAGRKR
jgi:beta-glucosidase